MDGIEWAQRALCIASPNDLQAWGVNVFFAPSVSPETKVVDLATGRVATFQLGEERPERGYYADFESLVRYCERHNLPFRETEGQVFIQPTAA
jgi:hypothetical protein